MNKFTLMAGAAALTLSAASHAHFQMMYTPTSQLEKPTTLDMNLVFGHPMENGHTMNMDRPEQFFVVFKDKKTDLLNKLKKISWKSHGHKADAYEVEYKVRRNGDYLFGLVPAPYYEAGEDIYIQQLTKRVINKGALPTGWDQPIGLKTEIVPKNKPYQIFAGSTFTGQLLSSGKPAAGIECEIEFVNTDVDAKGNGFGTKTNGPTPASAMVAITDDNGMFTFGIPKAGKWGFACLGAGPDTEYKGKELSQDAVIWIEAQDL
jgi:cobalt/nickel transport protein